MNALFQLLVACEALLQTVGETFWTDKIKRILRKGKDGEAIDIQLVEEIISWYGGMGSFNDLMISECNGHLVNSDDENKLNDELNKLRGAIYEEAVKLMR